MAEPSPEWRSTEGPQPEGRPSGDRPPPERPPAERLSPERLSLDEVLELERRFLSPSARLPFIPLLVESGAGTSFTDSAGRELLDFHSMACILNTGHNHPAVVRAIRDQAQRLVHCNSAYASHALPAVLGARLAGLAPGSGDRRVAFGLSGSDANDGALKLARAATSRPKVIAFLNAYHGNTYGALSLSASTLTMRQGFGPVVPDIYHVPFPDPYRGAPGVDPAAVVDHCLGQIDELLRTVVDPRELAAFVLEPIQGDAGIVSPPPTFLAGLQERSRRHGALIVVDEVQTGMGRTGDWFAFSGTPLEPDIVVLGKSLGSGMPVSAIVARAELMDHWRAPGHVFSTGANPVCCAAAVATIDVLRDEGLAANAERLGAQLLQALRTLADDFEVIGDVRGRGLMLGVDLVTDRDTRERARALAAKVVLGCFRRGVFMTFLRGSVLRIAPPLVLDQAALDRFLAVLEEALRDAVAGRVPDEDVAELEGW